MTNHTITFIGAGKMATTLIDGLIKAGHQSADIWASCPTAAHLHELQARFGICISQENITAASVADILVLAVKPQVMPGVLAQLRPVMAKRKPLVISVAASITEAAISKALGEGVAVIRAMPNTPALVRQSITVLYAQKSVSAEQRQQAQVIFQAVGATLWLDDETQMNTVTALSGSGPAYFFLLMEALTAAGVALGLSHEVARQLTLQTALGSACMACESTENLLELRQQVTSKGGGTASAMQLLESRQFTQLVFDAVKAAKLRYDAMAG